MKIGVKNYGILMDRQAIDSQIFILKPKYVISGTVVQDDIGLKLIDDMKNEYYLSDDTNTILFEVNTSVAFLLSEEELMEKYSSETINAARAKFFNHICSSVHFYSAESIINDKIGIISIDLAEMIARNYADTYLGLSEKCDSEELDISSLSDLLDKMDGDEIVAVPIEQLRNIIRSGKIDVIKKQLQKLVDDTIELNTHFLMQEPKRKKGSQIVSNKLTGDAIVAMFNSFCEQVLMLRSLKELKKIVDSFNGELINIMTILEKRSDGTEDVDYAEAAIDFMERLICDLEDLLKENDLAVVKASIAEIQAKEILNIKQTASCFDKYDQIFLEQRKNQKTSKTVDTADLMSARDMKSFLDHHVVGQDEAKKDIISALIMNSLSDNPEDRNACLLVGPTGSGKTLIISTIAKYLDRPVEIIDTTQLTMPGYVGGSIEDCLSNLIDKAGGDTKRAEEGVVSFDEIDKKGSEKNGDISGRGVLNTLLSFIQGTTYQVKYNGKTVPFNTSKLTIFATGAFTEAVKKLQEEKGASKKPIGFATDNKVSDSKEDIKYPKLTGEILAQYGNIPEELLGRIPVITQLEGHTKVSLKRILTESESSALLAEQQKLAKIGVQLKWTSGYIEALINQALSLKTGARSLKSAVEKSVKEARWAVLDNLGTYRGIILGSASITDNLECTLIDVEGQSHKLKDLLAKEEKAKIKQFKAFN